MLRKSQIWFNLRNARKQANWYGHCKIFVRTVLAIPSNGNPTAYASWCGAKKKHIGLAGVPPFHPVYFAPTAHNPAGHIVLSAGLKRNASKWCWSTDIGGKGTITRRTYADVEEWCGGRLLGWSEDLDDKPVEYV
jgi:hypothetical protein